MNRIEKRIDLLYALRKNSLNNILEKFHLTYEDYQLIKIIRYMEGNSIKKLRSESKLDAYSLDMIMNDLLKKNFIYIEDERLYLSDEVKEIYPKIKKRIKKKDHELMACMNKKEISQIIDSLDKLIEYYEE